MTISRTVGVKDLSTAFTFCIFSCCMAWLSLSVFFHVAWQFWFGSVRTERLNDKDKLIWLMSTEDSNLIHLVYQLLSSLSEERILKLRA